MSESAKLASLKEILKSLYTKHSALLPYHGLHHIIFVSKKAIFFGASINANLFLIESASLVHDLNYIVRINSSPMEGHSLRERILTEAGYAALERALIEQIVIEAHTETRGNSLSNEGKALSDADTLFKTLPITPILLAGKYIQQNKVDVASLARKIVLEQRPLFEHGIYFYTESAKKYLYWAETNLRLWENVEECLQDADAQELVSNMTEFRYK